MIKMATLHWEIFKNSIKKAFNFIHKLIDMKVKNMKKSNYNFIKEIKIIYHPIKWMLKNV